MTSISSHLFLNIKKTIQTLNPDALPHERKTTLKPFIEYIQTKVSNKQEVRMNFICTHNSRRSHLSQVWAQSMACHFNIKNVFCYSGGTEVTALFPMVAETLKNTGFNIQVLSEGNNPIYSIKYSNNEHPIIGFSKKMNDAFNPESDFLAVMTCAQANADCPFVAGAEKRISLTFEDPKVFDNTALQAEKYHERSLQIATELMYVFSQIKV